MWRSHVLILIFLAGSISASLLGCGGGSSGGGGQQTAALAITGTLPNTGSVASGYTGTLSASGGAGVFTWKAKGLPDGLTIQANTAVLQVFGTPTVSGTFPGSATVTDKNGTSVTSTFSIVVAPACPARGNEAALKAAVPYALLVKGIDENGLQFGIAASFTPNGKGAITGGEFDYNGYSLLSAQHAALDPSIATYSFGRDGRGCLFLEFPSSVFDYGIVVPNMRFRFALATKNGSGVYTTGRIIEFDDTPVGNIIASGMMHAQDPTSFTLSALRPNYVFGSDRIVGTFANNAGTLSAGFSDLGAGELSGGNGAIDSTFTSNGRGSGHYTIPVPGGIDVSFGFAVYMLNASDFYLMSSDALDFESNPNGFLVSGRALATNTSFPANPLNGNYLLAETGLAYDDYLDNEPGNFAEVGTLQALSSNAVPTGTIYANSDNGYLQTKSVSNETYTATAEGRISFTGALGVLPIVYLTGGGDVGEAIEGFTMSNHLFFYSSGVLVNQGAFPPNFSVADITGVFASGTEADPDNTNGATESSYAFNGEGTYSATQDTTKPGELSNANMSSSGAYTTNSDGSGTLGADLFYVTNGSQIFALPTEADPQLIVLTK